MLQPSKHTTMKRNWCEFFETNHVFKNAPVAAGLSRSEISKLAAGLYKILSSDIHSAYEKSYMKIVLLKQLFTKKQLKLFQLICDELPVTPSRHTTRERRSCECLETKHVLKNAPVADWM